MRTPKRLMNGLSIMIFRLREQGMKLQDIASETELKDHSEVYYHLKRYNDMISINPRFQKVEKDFKMEDFKEVYAAERERKRKALEQSTNKGLVEKACQTQS